MKLKHQIENVIDFLLKRSFGEVQWYEHLLKRGRITKSDYYDHLTRVIIEKALQKNSVCVDVGCHVGSILTLMMKSAPEGTFYAFEPIPGLYQQLVRDFTMANVHLFNVALSNEKGTTSFNFVKSNPGYSGLKRRKYDQPDEVDEQIEVSTEMLDHILPAGQPEKIDLIKIDVEGAEFLVMQGGQQRIARDKPVIIFEHGLGGADCYGKGPEDVFDLLNVKCGLKISLLPSWLLGSPSLSRLEFCEQFYKGKNYYFIAHP